MSRRLTHEEFAQGLIDAGFRRVECDDDQFDLYYYDNGIYRKGDPVAVCHDDTFVSWIGIYGCSEKNLKTVIKTYNIKFEV
jgi:hypothetical protein